MEVTYICGQTGLRVVSSDGLPEGWVIPTYSLSTEEGETKPPPPKYSVVAFSSKAAMEKYIEENMSEKF